MLENEWNKIHPLIVKFTRYAGGKRYWLEEADTRLIVAHISDHGLGSKYAYLFAAAPDMRHAIGELLLRKTFDPLTYNTLQYIYRKGTAIP